MVKQQENDTACLDRAIALAQAREQTALITVFMEQLQEFFPAHSARLFDVIPGEKLLLKENGIDADESAEADEFVQHACESQKNQLTDTAGEMRAVCPVHGVGRIKHIIEVRGQSIDAAQNLALDRLTTLFNSHFLLLEKNNHDALTSLYNRQAFDDRLQQVTENRHKRNSGRHIQRCLAFLDIDHFKQVNDNYGHLYGDEVLILFAGFMEKTFRHEDMLFRYGGEEFAVILNDVDLDIALRALERFRHNIETHDFPIVSKVTVSTGLTQISPGTLPTVLLDRADKALYYSKENGRNQINIFEQLHAEGKVSDEKPRPSNVELFYLELRERQ